MASVRLTQELKRQILNAIENDFATVKEGYVISEDIKTKVDEYARARLERAIAERKSTADAVISAVDDKLRALGAGATTDEMARGITKSLCSHVGGWSSFYVRAIDPESEDGDLVNIFEARVPYSSLGTDERLVLSWSDVLENNYTTNQELVDEILPDFLQLRALRQAENVSRQYAKNMFTNCNTLTQLVRKWPDAVRYVPESKLDAMRDKTRHKVKVEEEPASIMNMDDALKSINLQATAVKALNQ